MELKYEKLNNILAVFYEHPGESFTVRALARHARIPPTTVQCYLAFLKHKKLITSENRAADSFLFKTKKINYYIEKIVSCGLLEYLINEFNPSCIILFGGIRKGDSTSESDIDLFVETPHKKEVALIRFEKLLNHPIQLFVETNIHNLQPRLMNNVVNGIKLYGAFQIR